LDLDRREAQAARAVDSTGIAYESREPGARISVVKHRGSRGEDDLAMPLRDAPADPASTAAADRRGCRPRTSGMTQKLPREEQPSWIFTNARTRSSQVVRLDAADRADIAATRRGQRRRPVLGSTTTFAGIPSNAPSRFAAQPVT